jgi:mono/diheme cytochrome c family protein
MISFRSAWKPRRLVIAATVLLGAWLVWSVMPGLPVLRAPRARADVKQAGLVLFEHSWKPHDPMAGGDGLGPVYNARSCVACHFQGGVGGGGGNTHNVVAFEAHPTRSHPEVRSGTVHKHAVSEELRESRRALCELFPVVVNGVKIVGVCFSSREDFDPIRTESLNSIALFGAGWIDRISPKTIRFQSMQNSVASVTKELRLDLSGMRAGRPRVLPDGRIGKFGWKAQFATLEEFVANACANEIGLGTPTVEQARPLVEPLYPVVKPDLDAKQFRSLVAFVDTLPRPALVLPADPAERSQVERGQALFEGIGCAKCHTPSIGGVAGVYSDFLLHRLDDESEGKKGYSEVPDVELPPDHPLPEEWKTPPLWGVADSAPYFHDGGTPTLEAAIQRHLGDALIVTQAYRKLPANDQSALLAFLKSLKAPSVAAPAATDPKGELAMTR